MFTRPGNIQESNNPAKYIKKSDPTMETRETSLVMVYMGPLMGFPCHLSILRNGNVTCLCRLFLPMPHVKFKKWKCHKSLSFSFPCRKSLSFSFPCRMSPCPISSVDFKKELCRRVEFKGQGPLKCPSNMPCCLTL